MQLWIPVLFSLVAFSGITTNAYGHTEINIEDYVIDIGWGDEPPVVGFRNFIVMKVLQEKDDGEKLEVSDAFQNIKVFARSGGISKELDVIEDSESGNYHAKIIPTQVGTIAIKLRGDISGTIVDIQVPIEDVESTAVLDFPPMSSSSSEQDIASLKNAVNSIQSTISELKLGTNVAEMSSNQTSSEDSLNFGIIGMASGIAGTVLAIFCLLKRK